MPLGRPCQILLLNTCYQKNYNEKSPDKFYKKNLDLNFSLNNKIVQMKKTKIKIPII